MYAYFNPKYVTFYWVDIIYLILYQINDYWYNSFDLTTRSVYEDYSYSLTGGQMRRLYDNRSEFAK